MPLPNKVIVATAGSGKTTGIASAACEHADRRSALITYTRNGSAELRESVYRERGFVPGHVEVGTWFTFLLQHFVRPYQPSLYNLAPVRKLAFVEGRSAKFAKKTDIDRFYFASPGQIYSDKIAQFACAVIEATKGLPIKRIEGVFDRLYVDEAQDLAGYDLDLVEYLLSSKVEVTMVGDVRQGTYRTNNSPKNKQYGGAKIVDKFREWEAAGRVDLEFQTHSRRCVQSICDLADRFYPDLPGTVSNNQNETGHDGIFAVRRSNAKAYYHLFRPQALRLDAKTKDVVGIPMNFGAAKGKTFERTIIFPHGKLLNVLRNGDVGQLGAAPSTIAKVYVAITRARQSVSFVVPDDFEPAEIELFDPDLYPN